MDEMSRTLRILEEIDDQRIKWILEQDELDDLAQKGELIDVSIKSRGMVRRKLQEKHKKIYKKT